MRNSNLPQPDLQLILDCKKGNKEAFRHLVEKYQKYVFIVALRILCNEEDAKDIVQETFIRIWKHIREFDHNKLFTTWIYTIIGNLCHDKIRSDKKNHNLKLHTIENQKVNETIENDSDKLIDNNKLIERIKKLVNELTEKQRMVFILRDFQDLSVKEVGKILRMNEGSVKTNLYYARLSIRNKLNFEGNGGNENEL